MRRRQRGGVSSWGPCEERLSKGPECEGEREIVRTKGETNACAIKSAHKGKTLGAFEAKTLQITLGNSSQ